MDEITNDWELDSMSQALLDCVQYDFEPFFTPSTTFMRQAIQSAQILNLAAVEGGTEMTPAQLAECVHECRDDMAKPWQDLTFMPESPYSEHGIVWLSEVAKRYGGV